MEVHDSTAEMLTVTVTNAMNLSCLTVPSLSQGPHQRSRYGLATQKRGLHTVTIRSESPGSLLEMQNLSPTPTAESKCTF